VEGKEEKAEEEEA